MYMCDVESDKVESLFGLILFGKSKRLVNCDDRQPYSIVAEPLTARVWGSREPQCELAARPPEDRQEAVCVSKRFYGVWACQGVSGGAEIYQKLTNLSLTHLRSEPTEAPGGFNSEAAPKRRRW